MATEADLILINGYLEARAALVEATGITQSFIDGVVRDAGYFGGGRWRRVLFSNANFPIEALGRRAENTIDAGSWPTGQQIAERVLAWHNARHAAEQAWHRLTPEQRQGMQALPD